MAAVARSLLNLQGMMKMVLSILSFGKDVFKDRGAEGRTKKHVLLHI